MVLLRASLPTNWDSIYSALLEVVGAIPKFMDLPMDMPLRYCGAQREKIRRREKVREAQKIN